MCKVNIAAYEQKNFAAGHKRPMASWWLIHGVKSRLDNNKRARLEGLHFQFSLD